MVAESKVVYHSNNIRSTIWILLSEVLEYSNFLLRLTMKPLLVAYHLKSNRHAVLVVIDLDHLPEASLAKHLQNFIAVYNMVVWHMKVRAVFIIITIVVQSVKYARLLFGILTHEENLFMNNN